MHSLLSRYCFHSIRSNLLSLPRTNGTVVTGIELENFWELLLLDLRAHAGGVDLAGVKILNIASVDLPLL